MQATERELLEGLDPAEEAALRTMLERVRERAASLSGATRR